MACRHSAVHSVYSPYFFPYHSLCSSSPHSTHVNIYIVVLGAVCPSLSFARCLCLCNTNVFGLLCVWCVCVYEPDSVIAPFVCMSGEWWIWTHTSTILLKTYIRIHNILSECVQHSNKKKKNNASPFIDTHCVVQYWPDCVANWFTKPHIHSFSLIETNRSSCCTCRILVYPKHDEKYPLQWVISSPPNRTHIEYGPVCTIFFLDFFTFSLFLFIPLFFSISLHWTFFVRFFCMFGRAFHLTQSLYPCCISSIFFFCCSFWRALTIRWFLWMEWSGSCLRNFLFSAAMESKSGSVFGC